MLWHHLFGFHTQWSWQLWALLTPDMVDLMNEEYLQEMTAEGYTRQNKVYAIKNRGVDIMPIKKIAFKYLHRFTVGDYF